jgi:hypothetical protein
VRVEAARLPLYAGATTAVAAALSTAATAREGGAIPAGRGVPGRGVGVGGDEEEADNDSPSTPLAGSPACLRQVSQPLLV